MRSLARIRSFSALLVIFCLLAAQVAASGRKGEKNYQQGLRYEAAQQWAKAAEEFTLALAADPANIQYQLHYRRAIFNASQALMQQARALAQQRDYVGAYNACRQAYSYDSTNELALAEAQRMLRLQREKEDAKGSDEPANSSFEAKTSPTSYQPESMPARADQRQPQLPQPPRTEKLRVINYSGDLKNFIRSLAEQLHLDVIFDAASFQNKRNIEISLHDITSAKALDYIFLQENLFFQKLDRRTILVADQAKRPLYQQLTIRTFYLANIDPNDARAMIQQAIPAQQGRPAPNVIANKSTNSITVRDTSENIRLIGDLLQGIDKDLAEVVMEVNIYEMQRNDILQLGNQLGTNATLTRLGGTSGLNILGGSGEVASRLFSSLPTAMGAAIAIPPSVLSAFQKKDRNRLLASTQIHAFDRESSRARIGQRVPVQTAQVTPFGFNSGGTGTAPPGGTAGLFGGTGFPVINYEPVGLTLDFTPQVFPNLDVQVKMTIESKDVQGIGTLTPTFTERSISGTARIQNNQTMMIASVAQDNQSRGREGLPLLGLIPIFGRLFSTPTRNNFKTDIVITVTPHVLRAPAITPRDKDPHPSGTQQTPASESLEAMLQESAREEQQQQLAATQRTPKEVVVQLPDAEAPAYVPAPKALMDGAGASSANATAATNASTTTGASTAAEKSASPRASDSAFLTIERLEPTREAKSIEQPKPVSLSLVVSPAVEKSKEQRDSVSSPTAEFYMMPDRQEMRVGEKRRLMVLLKTDAQVNLAAMTLRFDPRIVTVKAAANSIDNAPTLTQAVDPTGKLTISVSPPKGAPPITGACVLILLDVEALAAGESAIAFDGDAMHLISSAGGDISPARVAQSSISVKQ